MSDKASEMSENELPADFESALKAAMKSFSYTDSTSAVLYRKLRQKGFSEDGSRAAVEYMKEQGILNEKLLLESYVSTLCEKKLFGLSRIMAELKIKGFQSQLIDEFDFSEIDFEEICFKLYLKKGGEDSPKTRAFLSRYGHNYHDINAAVKRNLYGED